ncbi:MAG: DNA (cytosine-5-)-methyltransferase [Firmicutes bacterium]|nr:DNA (cytosine-5-)-methyltransferase [Bacillota bacterium]
MNETATQTQRKLNIWNNSVPVEKSAYIQEKGLQFFNIEKLVAPKGKLTMIDLFSGAGGFSVGCSWAGFFPVLGIDYLKPAVETWKKNHPTSISCLGDIRQANPISIRDVLRKKGVERINLITGGVPCQGFSIANRKHNDNDERNFLFIEYMKFVEIFNPDYVILENVSSLRSTAGGQFEKDIKKYMESLDYSVTIKTVNAAEYGVPQQRQRVLFIGVKKDNHLTVPFVFPEGNFRLPSDYRTVEMAISDLPELENDEAKTEYSSSPKTEFQRLMRGEINCIPISRPMKLFNHVSPNHPQETIDRIANTRQGMPMYPNFKQRIRLSLNVPSPTQLAGGIRPQFQFGHPTQSRGLTIRERARIQSFPDSYEFIGGIVQERVLTGNAVPPLLIFEIVKYIANDILRRDREVKNV